MYRKIITRGLRTLKKRSSESSEVVLPSSEEELQRLYERTSFSVDEATGEKSPKPYQLPKEREKGRARQKHAYKRILVQNEPSIDGHEGKLTPSFAERLSRYTEESVNRKNASQSSMRQTFPAREDRGRQNQSNDVLPREKVESPLKILRKKLVFEGCGLSLPLEYPITVDNHHYALQQCMTPLHELQYRDQLLKKAKYVRELLKCLCKRMSTSDYGETVGKYFKIPLGDIVPSPDILSFRNNDEFSIGQGADGNPKTVGYFVGSPKDPLMRCVPPTHLVSVKDSHKLVAKHFQNFIRNSVHDICLDFRQGGVWRNVKVRSNQLDEVMATVKVYSDPQIEEQNRRELLEQVKQDLKNYFFKGEGAECGLSSLYIQASNRASCDGGTAPNELIGGEEHIEESLLGVPFALKPDSQFRINTKASELLYRSVISISEMSSLTTLIDLGQFSGIVSSVCSPAVRGSIVINPSSYVLDAVESNYDYSGVQNVTSIVSEVDQILPILKPNLETCSGVTAILDPGNGGCHPAVIEAIRECEPIQKLVYITDKPEGIAMHNFDQLTTTTGHYQKWKMSRDKRGPPFFPKYAVPLDAYPFTKYVQMVVLFERLNT